jgi:hypothetical protein
VLSNDSSGTGPAVSGISTDGRWITGTGKKDGVASGWVILIPEPSSFAVLAIGILPLIKLRRRK